MPAILPTPSECVEPCESPLVVNVPGPQGDAGADGADGADGANSFTQTAAPFDVPDVCDEVTIEVDSSAGFAVGQWIFIQNAGYFKITAIPDGTHLTIYNPGYSENAPPGATVALDNDVVPGGVQGASGGDDTFTYTTADFVMPNVAATVLVTVDSSSFFEVGMRAFVNTAGYFTVTDVPDGTHLELENEGAPGNAAPTTNISTGVSVQSVMTLNSVSPTTAKGDLITDDGANAPQSSTIKLAAGSDGEVLVADSAESVGLKWMAILPSAATDNGVPRFNGATGDPIPLQTSAVVITDDGNIQASGSGGNARGTNAIDLQTERANATEVASGVESVIGGGDSNTASGDNSTIPGGLNNEASGDYTAIPGGRDAIADKYAQVAHASGKFNADGDAQASYLIMRAATTDGSTVEMFLDGTAERATVPSGKSWCAHILVVGRQDNGDSAIWQIPCGIKNNSGTTALIGSATTALIGADAGCAGDWGQAANVVVTADNTNDSLKIDVTGNVGDNVRWVAHLRIVEVGY